MRRRPHAHDARRGARARLRPPRLFGHADAAHDVQTLQREARVALGGAREDANTAENTPYQKIMPDDDEPDDPLHQVQALVEGTCVHIKEDTYVKICDALRRAYDDREDAKVFDVVLSRTSANAVVDCEGDTDVSVHMWTSPATLTCKPLTLDEAIQTAATSADLLLQGKYRRHWLQRKTPYVLHDRLETVTVVRVRSAKRARGIDPTA